MLASMMRLIKICLLIFGLVSSFAEADVQSKKNTRPNITVGDEKLLKESNDIPTTFDFSTYARSFGKTYNLEEAAKKSKLFIGRTLLIFQHNFLYMKHKRNYYLAQNEFLDLTPEELSQNHYIGQDNEFKKIEQNSDSLINPPINQQPVRGSKKINLKEIITNDLDIKAQTRDASKSFLSQTSGQRVQPDTNQSNSSPLLTKILAEIININENKMDPKAKTTLDFTSDKESVESISQIMDQLKASPQLAKVMADIVNLNSINERDACVVSSINNDIENVSIVASNNDRYHPQMIMSYGFFQDWIPMDNFANVCNPKRAKSPVELWADKQMQMLTLENELRKVLVQAVLSGLLDGLKGFLDHIKYIDPPDDDVNESQPPVFEDSNDPKDSTEYDIDWRYTGCISRPKYQSSCNSCYAFAVLGLMEFFYCKQTKKLTSFSAQYVIDCGSKSRLRGCDGGKMLNVGLFIKKYGIELNAIYPYTGLKGHCPIGEQEDLGRIAGYLRPTITGWQMFNDPSTWYRWLRKSPIVVGINMPSDFLAYAGGVHSGLNCDPNRTHAMLLVGSGIERGEAFWLMKNSYSELWGEGGYFKLSKNASSTCFNSALVARVNFPEKAL